MDELNLVQNVGEIGTYLKPAMTEALGDHPNDGDVRGEGMFYAVEFVEDKADQIRSFGARRDDGITVIVRMPCRHRLALARWGGQGTGIQGQPGSARRSSRRARAGDMLKFTPH